MGCSSKKKHWWCYEVRQKVIGLIRLSIILILCTSAFAYQHDHQNDLDAIHRKIQKSALLREIDSVAVYGSTAIKFALAGNDSIGLAKTYLQLANSYFVANLFDSSFKYFPIAASIFENKEDYLEAAYVYKQLGTNYKGKLQFEKALDSYHRSLELFFQLKDSAEMSFLYTSLASLNRIQGNFQQSLEQAQKSIQIAKSISDKMLIGLGMIERGLGFVAIDQYDSALSLGQNSLALFEIEKIGFGKTESHHLIAEAMLGLKMYKQAKEFVTKYNRDADKSGNLSSMANAKHLLARQFIADKKYSDAIGELDKMIPYSKRMSNNSKVMEAEKLLSFCYSELGREAEALHHINKYINLKDSTYSVEKSKEIEKLQAQYSLKSKQREIEQLETVSELKDLKILQARDRLILIALASFATLVIIFLIYNRKLFKQKLKFVEEQERLQKNRFKAVIDAEEKERKRIAQELHDGLGQILSTARLSISSLDEDEQNQNVQHSLKLIDSAVDETRTISHNMMPNALVSIGLEAALKDLVRNINKAGSIKVAIEIDQLPTIEESTSVAIYRIVQETINNALKYANASTIKVQVVVKNEMILTISDNGKGFDTSDIENSGGIGWKNIYSRAGLINGNVSVFSKLGEGTTVKITLPINESIKTATG
jgi:two-component system, NarL family, sensor kinase